MLSIRGRVFKAERGVRGIGFYEGFRLYLW